MASPTATNRPSARNRAPSASGALRARGGHPPVATNGARDSRNPPMQVFSVTDANLPDGFHMATPIRAVACVEDAGIGVSDPVFGLYEAGQTLDEARRAFGTRLVREMQWLKRWEDSLSARLQRMLAWLSQSIEADR